jgi:hypothetical protein
MRILSIYDGPKICPEVRDFGIAEFHKHNSTHNYEKDGQMPK